ncbi:hypothetical protein Tco_1420898 [Tanacetum coccineum]
MCNPATMVSYSASLLDASNLNPKAVHGLGIASSTCNSMSGPSLSRLSAMKSAKIWSRMDVLGLTALTASLAS